MRKEPFRFTLFLLICLSFPMIGTAQTVDIPDPNLRAAIETELGKASGDPITAEDMTTLIFLGISNANISDLTGLEGATNLLYLFLWDNSISDLSPLADLTSLQFLDLWNNSVSDLSPVRGLTNLIFLGLRNNSVSDLFPLVANTGLGEGNGVNAKKNLLDYSSIYVDIPGLQRRGVEVRFDSRMLTTPRIISGDAQSDTVGVTLAQPFVVEVRDENGEAFEGVPVVFTVTAGGGTVQPKGATTNAEGRAASTLTLGSEPGTNTVELRVGGIPRQAVFSAEANPRVPTALSIVLGDNQSGLTDEALANPFVVEVRDQRNDPLEGVAVTFVVSVGGGMLSDISVDTDANGLAQSILTPGRERGTNTVEVSVEGIAERVTFNALAETLLFDLSVPSGLSLIHVPLKVMSVDGREGTIESVGDLYYALGGAATINQLTTYNPDTQGWQNYLDDTSADRPLTDEMGIIANMSVPVSVRLGGDALGVDGSSTITVNQGANLVGLPLKDPRITRVSDLFTLEGIANNVSAITVSDNGTLKAVRQAGDDGDISVTGGQAFLLRASEAAIVTLSGEGWKHTAATAAPSLVLGGIQSFTLAIVSGDNQNGLLGEALASPFVVEVHNQNDEPMEGVPVTFVVSTGGGSLSHEIGTTDANGRAESILTLGSAPGTNTVTVSVEGITEAVTFNAVTESIQFDLSVPSGVNLIHVPLKVMSVDGMARVIKSVGDLYDVLGGAATVNLLTTYNPDTQGWQSYLGDTSADRPLTDEMGIIANMSVPVSVRLGGDALGVDGSSTITVNQGANLVGLPLKDPRITRVSDLFTLEGIANNVSTITVSDNGTLKAVRQAGDDGDISVTGGQAFLLRASEAAMVTLSGEGWKHTAATAAPSLVLGGLQVSGTTPVLALSGSVIDQGQRINSADFRVIVKNLSSGNAVATVIESSARAQVGYQLTVVDMERGRAAAIGDILEISVRSTAASIGVEPLRYTVTVEDVKRSWIQLPALAIYEIPAETELLRNYPNPFNPETWIPYRLAEDAFVTLTIYDGSGQVVRTLDVGHQVAAVYESRSKAVYWDGRNGFGEQVASGVYFYHLSAGDFSATRKMVILK